MSILDVKELEVAFGGVEVLRGLDMAVDAGTLCAIVGSNGAGKTTLLRTLSGLVRPRQGKVAFDGTVINTMPAHEITRLGLIHVPQGRQIVPTLTVEENLSIGARSLGVRTEELRERMEKEYARFPVLRERSHIPGGSLSGGEQQMLAVSRALMMKPRVLMLDEPSLGLAPQVISSIFRALRGLTEAGVTVLLVEQVALAALKIADHGFVLQNGRFVMSGPASRLLADPSLVKSYLG